jgi:hypothetical protein
MKLTSNQIGHMGEMYVLYKLFLFGIRAIQLHDMFDYDLLTQEDIKIEVKTSSIVLDKDKRKVNYKREIYHFLNYKRTLNYIKGKKFEYIDDFRIRKCDFYILLCLDESQEVESVYIVPNDVIHNRKLITIPRFPKNDKFMLTQFKNNWNLIIDY